MAQNRKADTEQLLVTEENLSINRVAELVGVNRATIERLLNRRELGYYQVGRRRLIGRQHLQVYLSQVERKAESEL